MLNVRNLLPAFLVLLCAAQLNAQTGVITGRVLDTSTQRPIVGANVVMVGTRIGTITEASGNFRLAGVPAGTHRVAASLIGYVSEQQQVTVESGSTASLQFSLSQEAVAIKEVVAIGYGTRKREAITGSVAVVDAAEANVGVQTNANDMLQGRVAGLLVTTNNGEPGSDAQIRIRGGTSISASDQPLYVIDGVPIDNVPTEASGIGVGGNPALSRSPLNLLNPSDIASITVLKDASAAAIYGARGANGVILIETKKGGVAGLGGLDIHYDGYVASSSPAKYLNVLNGDQYRSFITDQVAKGKLAKERLTSLGTANTDWERAVTRTAMTHNHNLTFSGGGLNTRFRASLNYMKQEGVVINNGLERVQGRFSASHNAWNDRLRLSANLTSSHLNNDYLCYENGGGFEGCVFQNMVAFNPTNPITVTDPTGTSRYYEIGAGSQSSRNPVGLANQVEDVGKSTRALGNAKAELDVLSWLTGSINVGIDQSDGLRQTYLPAASPVGAEFGGRARQVSRGNNAATFQGLLTARRTIADIHDVEIVGGYEYNDYHLSEFGAEGRGFITDAFSFNNLSGGSVKVTPYSFRQDHRLKSVFGRANYSLRDRYFVTAVLRRDGSSRFGANNKYATFPAVSASWRVSQEDFMRGRTFSELRLRAGYGIQGNEAVPPYASLITLEPGRKYTFGEQNYVSIAPVRNPNPALKWEQTSQWNAAVDYGFSENRYTGTLEFYNKNTNDLLLEVDVPQPAAVGSRLENIGQIRNRGVEFALDAKVIDNSRWSWSSGLTFSLERGKVVDLGGRTFIGTGYMSGQGQSGTPSQRIIPGSPLGTFWGPEYVGVDAAGKQQFNKYEVTRDAKGNVTSRKLIGKTDLPGGDDFTIIGDANPKFTLNVRSQMTHSRWDGSFLIRSEVGMDVLNNTALVYSTKGNALQGKNFLESALTDPTDIGEPAIYSSRWIEKGSFARLQNLTIGYTFDLPGSASRKTRAYLSGDNLLLLTGYSGYDPEVHTSNGGLAVRGIDYLVYPRARTFTVGASVGL